MIIIQNLAAKYRPSKLSEVTGQSVIVDILEHICESKELTHRNFLFIGPAGCGKTTFSKILASKLNEGATNVQNNLIEIDAASHSGVDSMREIVNQARAYPIGAKYKVFVIDECFPGSSLVHTTSGLVPIKEVTPGTRVYNLTGEATVSHVFENSVKVENLICLHIGNKDIVTTKNHLFFTDEGWVEAIDLKEGDILYDYKTMQDMRNRIPSSILQRSQSILQQGVQKDWTASDQSVDGGDSIRQYIEGLSCLYESILDSQIRECSDLQRQLWSDIQERVSSLGQVERAAIKMLAYIHMSEVWKGDGDSQERPSSSLRSKLRFSANGSSEASGIYEESCDEVLRELWERISSSIFQQVSKNLQSSMPNSSISLEEFNTASGNLQSDVRTNEGEQSWIRPSYSSEDARNKIKEWYIDSTSAYEVWERSLLQASDAFERGAGARVGVRICNSDCNRQEEQSESLSYELQSRPCLTKIEARSRGGWDRPQYEITTTVRRKESEISRIVRVDSIESYKRGSNDELFQDYFPDTALRDAAYVTMYDLAVEGHPSYYIEDILVHNCHALSPAAWQAALLTIESQPAMSVFCWCTTNPEKIPGTILSRVQTFQLSKISLEGIDARLKYIIKQENAEGANITYDDDAILYLAKLAQGGMRDAITNLDQCLAHSSHVSIQSVVETLGLPSYDDYFELLNSIAKKDNNKIVEIINTVYNSGVNFVKWFDGFFSFITNIVKFIYLQDINQTMIPSIYQDKIKGYGVQHAALCLKLSNKLVKMNQELKTTQYLQELAISYLCSVPAPKK